MTLLTTLWRPATIGAVSGLRSQAGIAALAILRPEALPARGPKVRLAVLAAGVGELVGDKLPITPSRLAAGPLGGRLAFGALSAGLLARSDGGRPAPAALLGAVKAAGAAWAGHAARGRLAARLGTDLPGALAEDALVVGLAYAAARR